MAERISGLSISLDMETAQIDRSLSEIRSSFGALRRSAQVNMNNIKFGNKDVETYKKSVDELTKSYDAQKTNANDLKKRIELMGGTLSATAKEMEKLKEAGEENSDEYKELNKEYKEQKETLKKVNGEYNRSVDELNKLGHALDDARGELHKLNVENSGFTKIGNAAETAGGGIQTFGGHVKDVGGSLTKWITAPVLGAITAAGGLTAAFGWGRLVGLDNAKAQLEGMGYSLEEVDDITGQVSDAIQGGMMTMAEGT